MVRHIEAVKKSASKEMQVKMVQLLEREGQSMDKWGFMVVVLGI